MVKEFWFDTETTGTNPEKHDIIQLGGIIVVDGKSVDAFELKQAPRSAQAVDERALVINKRQLAEIMAWPTPGTIYHELKRRLARHINQYDQSDFLVPAGHNVKFDMDFLFALWAQNGDNYLGSFLKGRLDTLVKASELYLAGVLEARNQRGSISFRLEDLCKVFGIEPGGHDAVGDIMATRQLWQEMEKMQTEAYLKASKKGQDSEVQDHSQAGDQAVEGSQ